MCTYNTQLVSAPSTSPSFSKQYSIILIKVSTYKLTKRSHRCSFCFQLTESLCYNNLSSFPLALVSKSFSATSIKDSKKKYQQWQDAGGNGPARCFYSFQPCQSTEEAADDSEKKKRKHRILRYHKHQAIGRIVWPQRRHSHPWQKTNPLGNAWSAIGCLKHSWQEEKKHLRHLICLSTVRSLPVQNFGTELWKIFRKPNVQKCLKTFFKRPNHPLCFKKCRNAQTYIRATTISQLINYLTDYFGTWVMMQVIFQVQIPNIWSSASKSV